MKKRLLQFYKDFYDLEELINSEEVDTGFFKTLRKDYSFVVIAIYNSKGEFLLTRNLTRTVGWEFPGGYIEDKERVEDAVNRIVLRETHLHIDELCPISIVRNIFTHGDKAIEHHGVAFKALVRGKPSGTPQSSNVIYTRIKPPKMAFQDEKIWDLVQKGADSIKMPPFNEISSFARFRIGYALNKFFVKRIGALASSKIHRKIKDLIFEDPKTILDPSCGDNNLVLDLHDQFKADYSVANDISWETISLIRKRDVNDGILFTNHNVQSLPFVKTFDLVLFKNTLHHIPRGSQEATLRSLSSISKQLIIVDIEDPLHSSKRAKLWNLYYRKCLGDQGGSFLSFNEFKALIKSSLPQSFVQTGKIKTIKGDYMFASIHNR